MASFEPPLPPLTPDAPEPAPGLDVPLPPPLVGLGSPWAPADAENRDRILDWWRMWFHRVFFPWIAAWVAYWAAQWARIIAYLNVWLTYAGEYIELHAVNGHSWWKTDDEIDPNTPTVVEIIPYDEYRPLLVGDLVSSTDNLRYGEIIQVIDDTHALVEYVGELRGLQGFAGNGWWVTPDDIAGSGTTTVIVPLHADRSIQVGDLVVDSSVFNRYGIVTEVTDPLTGEVEVDYQGTLRGSDGADGPEGPEGPEGPQGPAGVADDASVAALVNDDESLTRDALDAWLGESAVSRVIASLPATYTYNNSVAETDIFTYTFPVNPPDGTRIRLRLWGTILMNAGTGYSTTGRLRMGSTLLIAFPLGMGAASTTPWGMNVQFDFVFRSGSFNVGGDWHIINPMLGSSAQIINAYESVAPWSAANVLRVTTLMSNASTQFEVKLMGVVMESL